MEEADKARDQVEQDDYDVGVAKTEEALRVEVAGVCRNYCLQVWNKALNQAGVEASSILKKAESVYYPPAIRTLGSASSKVDTSSNVTKLGKGSFAEAPSSSDKPSEEAQQQEVAKNEADANKEVAPDATKPPAAPQDPPKEKEVPFTMEIVLATLPLPVKGDPKSKDSGSSEAAFSQSTKGPPKEKIVIKKK